MAVVSMDRNVIEKVKKMKVRMIFLLRNKVEECLRYSVTLKKCTRGAAK